MTNEKFKRKVIIKILFNGVCNQLFNALLPLKMDTTFPSTATPLYIYTGHAHLALSLTSLSIISSPISPLSHQVLCKMSGIKALVKDITTLSNTSPQSIQKGMKDDKIWSVMNAGKHDMEHETFNCQFDALFGEDC